MSNPDDLLPFEVVMLKHPTAHAMRITDGWWEVVDGCGHLLGRGTTQLEAWQDAAA